MSALNIQIKRNQFKAPRILVSAATTKKLLGSFSADNPKTFKGWSKLSLEETCELKHLMDNFVAINEYLGSDALLDSQSSIRLLLPLKLITIIKQISLLAHESGTAIDIYQGIILAIIQNLKGAVVTLSGDQKKAALSLLDTLGLAEYKKKDYSNEVKAIFSELLGIFNKSERLNATALRLFGKSKSFSPMTFETIAQAERPPSKWIISCAIDVLLSDKRQIVLKILSLHDIAILWAKPLLNAHQKKYVYDRIKELALHKLVPIIEDPSFPVDSLSAE